MNAFRLPLPPARLILLGVLLLSLGRLSAAESKFAELPGIAYGPNNSPQIPSVLAPSSIASPPLAETNSQPAVSTNAMDTLDERHRLANGDRISFRIIEDEEDPKPLLVTDSGELELPYLGRWPALGRTSKQLAFELKAALEKEYYFHATVIIAVDLMTKSRGKIYIDGPVRVPGPQDVPSDEILTLSHAISRAGGFTDDANKRNVQVTRISADGARQVFTINVGEIQEKSRTQNDLPLEPGDTIKVFQRIIKF